MIKSSDKVNNNTYRIIKVLGTQDYLVADQHQSAHILCQRPISRQNPKYGFQVQNEKILMQKQVISVNSLFYYVFDVKSKDVVWVKDVLQKQLQSAKFVNCFVSKVISNFLLSLLAMSHKQAIQIMNVNNLWFFNDEVYLLAMPRSSKGKISMKRTENMRSFSQETSSISSLLSRQQEVIKKLASVILQVLEGSWSSQEVSHSKQLLVKMMRKQIILSDIMMQITGKSSLLNSSARKYVHLTPLSENSCKRKYSQPVSLLTQSKRRSRLSFAQSKPSSNHKYSPLLIARNNVSHRNSNVKSAAQLTQQIYLQNNRKISVRKDIGYSLMTPKKTSLLKSNEEISDKSSYLGWLKRHKFSQNTLGRQFIEKRVKTQVQPVSNKQTQMKQRLLSKIQRYRSSRYCRSIQTQTSNNHEDVKNSNQTIENEVITQQKGHQKVEKIDNTKVDRRKVSRETDIKIDAKYDRSLKKKVDQDIKPEIVRKINFDSAQKPEITSHTKSLKNSSIWKQALHQFQHEDIQEVSFKSIDFLKKQKQEQKREAQKISSKMSVPSVNQKETKTLSNPIQKQLNQHVDIEVVNFKHHRKTNSSSIQQESKVISKEVRLKTEVSQDSSTPKRSSKKMESQPKSKMSSASLKEETKEDEKDDKLTEKINEYINMINILADISVSCVKNKRQLSRYNWRASIYFLYERFMQQRILLFQHIKNKQPRQIVRGHHEVSQKERRAWADSQHRNSLLIQVERQNVRIIDTYNRLASKTLEESDLQPNIQRFIRNRKNILESKKNQSIRLFLSKYAVAYIINEFDESAERNDDTQEQVEYLTKCLFGLMVIAELDGKEAAGKLNLSDYNIRWQRVDECAQKVERLYGIYYPQEADVLNK